METKLIQLVLEKLSDEHEKLKEEVKELRSELKSLRASNSNPGNSEVAHTEEDELLDYKEVQGMLGICYNSLKKLIDSGQIVPVRINERRIRFSKQSIFHYIKIKST